MQNHEMALAVEALKVLAHSYLEHERADKAAELLQALDYLGFSTNQTLASLALAQQLCGKPDTALQTVARIVLAADEGHLQAAVNLIRARALYNLENHGEALEAFHKYMESRAPGLINIQEEVV